MDAITLPFDIQLGVAIPDTDGDITKLTISRRPRAGDFKGCKTDEPTHDDQMLMISRLTNTSLAIIQQLDITDYNKVNAVVSSFLVLGPKIGPKPSAS